ncbi:unnamed protein product [Heligmosomoides polygyrus]|uniref:DZF domain-containing protein n=1 Tax=Heligmosomoides polygyrus TaxID=6339 RepID=A0A183G3W1_HELPZ|nr:unnamed protein product [Heligmosomoides polygyrus]
MLVKWFPRSNDSRTTQAVSLFRFLLQKLTDPPTAIQGYAVRVSGRAGRNTNLTHLPEDVENTLIEFALDMLGYGRNEISCPGSVDLPQSRFFLSLGTSHEERYAALEGLIEQREDWKKQLIKAVQLALRDVRNNRYVEVNGVPMWLSNPKKREEQREEEDRREERKEEDDLEWT